MFSISKYGIKVTDTTSHRVHARLPLHHVVNITYYLDTYGRHMLAVRVGRKVGEQQTLYIYESEDEVIMM